MLDSFLQMRLMELTKQPILQYMNVGALLKEIEISS
jgi:hypothetical protein